MTRADFLTEPREEAVASAEVNPAECALHSREASANVEMAADSVTPLKERSPLTLPPRRLPVPVTLSKEANATVAPHADSVTPKERPPVVRESQRLPESQESLLPPVLVYASTSSLIIASVVMVAVSYTSTVRLRSLSLVREACATRSREESVREVTLAASRTRRPRLSSLKHRCAMTIRCYMGVNMMRESRGIESPR